MSLGELSIQLLATIALVACRMAGFVLVSPFPGTSVPAQLRVGLVLALTLAAVPVVAWLPVTLATPLELIPIALVELAVGAVVGAVFRFVFAAVEVAGGVLGQATWLSSAATFNPTIGEQDSAMSSLVSLFALLLALGAGVHRVVLRYLFGSFGLIPVGTPVALDATAVAFIELGGRALEVGLRLALPVLFVSQLVQVALAFVARVAPQLQIFNVGFSILISSSLVALVAALPAIGAGIGEVFAVLPDALDGVLHALVPARGSGP